MIVVRGSDPKLVFSFVMRYLSYAALLRTEHCFVCLLFLT